MPPFFVDFSVIACPTELYMASSSVEIHRVIDFIFVEMLDTPERLRYDGNFASFCFASSYLSPTIPDDKNKTLDITVH